MLSDLWITMRGPNEYNEFEAVIYTYKLPPKIKFSSKSKMEAKFICP